MGLGRIRRLDAQSGIITTIAGIGQTGWSGDDGPATAAKIGTPAALCLDKHGNLYFADSLHHVIRKVDRSGRITTVVGNATVGYSPDGTRAAAAKLNTPRGVAVGTDGTLFFSDAGNNRVRFITSDGRLATLAGCGEGGDNGDKNVRTLNQVLTSHMVYVFMTKPPC